MALHTASFSSRSTKMCRGDKLLPRENWSTRLKKLVSEKLYSCSATGDQRQSGRAPGALIPN
eukprot:3502631-Pyramimonas_sp.AAC.1